MNEDKATRYHRRSRWAQAMAGAAGFAVLTLLVASGLVRWLAFEIQEASHGTARDRWASVVLECVMLVVVLGVAVVAARFPFDVFREWTLERSYGLERTPFRSWAGGYLRGIAVLGVLLAGAALVVRGMGWAGRVWWIATAAGLWIASIAWSVAAPLVLRAFGGLKPLDRPQVTERLRALGQRAGTSLDVYEWRGGDSRRAHAALGGLGRTRRVILSDTLLETLTVDEVEVVVAHELAHHVHGDAWTASVWRLIVLLLALGAAALVLDYVPAGLGAARPQDLAALPIVGLVGYGVSVILAPVGFALSRAHERRADAFAIETTSNTAAFLTSMRRLAASNLVEERPSRLTRLLSSHPSIQERIAGAAVRRTAAR